MVLSSLGHDTKTVLDVTGVATVIGAYMTENMPHIALALTIVWTLLRIYETDTVQKLVRGKKEEDE